MKIKPEETSNKYMGIFEGDIMHHEVKERNENEYMRRIKAVLKSKLNVRNTVRTINTWTAPVIQYSVGIENWKTQFSKRWTPQTGIKGQYI